MTFAEMYAKMRSVISRIYVTDEIKPGLMKIRASRDGNGIELALSHDDWEKAERPDEIGVPVVLG